MIRKTMVECQHWSMNHSSENWADPWAFKPERFLEDIPGNKLEALQAFSVGPRNCIGRKYVLDRLALLLETMWPLTKRNPSAWPMSRCALSWHA